MARGQHVLQPLYDRPSSGRPGRGAATAHGQSALQQPLRGAGPWRYARFRLPPRLKCYSTHPSLPCLRAGAGAKVLVRTSSIRLRREAIFRSPLARSLYYITQSCNPFQPSPARSHLSSISNRRFYSFCLLLRLRIIVNSSIDPNSRLSDGVNNLAFYNASQVDRVIPSHIATTVENREETREELERSTTSLSSKCIITFETRTKIL